jgi:hypothetical protein
MAESKFLASRHLKLHLKIRPERWHNKARSQQAPGQQCMTHFASSAWITWLSWWHSSIMTAIVNRQNRQGNVEFFVHFWSSWCNSFLKILKVCRPNATTFTLASYWRHLTKTDAIWQSFTKWPLNSEITVYNCNLCIWRDQYPSVYTCYYSAQIPYCLKK